MVPALLPVLSAVPHMHHSRRSREVHRRWASVATLLGVVTFVSGCGQEPFSGVVVNLTDNSFSPREIHVPVGGHVLFRNMGVTRHNAISVDRSWSTGDSLPDIGLQTGNWAEIVFDEEGVYRFYCSFHATPDGLQGMVGVVVVGDAQYNPAVADKGKLEAVEEPTGVTRHVPQDYPNIQTAVDAADPGDLVLVAEGVYREEVLVVTPSITIRGTSRNDVILDGEFQLGNGIAVFADAVAIENMTARNYNLNGFYWTNATGYRGSYITAVNNGDYGVFAFNATNGVWEHSYASGSPDAAYYIGQCYPCEAIMDDVIGEYSGSGYSGTNSGGDLYIVNSVFRHNGSGITPNTYDVELYPPERETTIVGNEVTNNGMGIRIAGGNNNLVARNLISNNRAFGVLVLAARDRNYWPATGNVIRDNVILESGRADIATSGLGNIDNCFEGNVHRTTLPWGLEILQGCGGMRVPLVGDLDSYMRMLRGRAGLFDDTDGVDPRGDEWKSNPHPGPQPEMPGGADAPVRPAVRPYHDYPLNITSVGLPPASPVLATTKN